MNNLIVKIGGVILIILSFLNSLNAQVQVSVQDIINDMYLPSDACTHGTEAMSWGCANAIVDANGECPRRNNKGEWFKAMTVWGQAYIPREGSTAVNTRLQIRNIVTKQLYKSGNWHTVQTGQPQGAAYVENFAGNANKGANARDESVNGGGVSVIVGVGEWSGYNYHFWPEGSRASVNIDSVVGVYTSCEARLIIDNPNKPDDRNQCKNLLAIGGDWWLNLTTGFLPDWSANSGFGGGRAKFATTEWQSYNMCILDSAAIRANPPISKIVIKSVTKVSLKQHEVNITSGIPTKLDFEIFPSTATNKYVAWKSSKPSVATIDQYGVVTGITAGVTTIFVISDFDNSIKDSCSIDVSSSEFTLVNIGNVDDGLRYTGGGYYWNSTGSINNDMYYVLGDQVCTASYTFVGTGVAVVGNKIAHPIGNKFIIKVDGDSIAGGFTNSPVDSIDIVLGSVKGLPLGTHTVVFATLGGQHNPWSGPDPKGVITGLDALYIYGNVTAINTIAYNSQFVVYPNPVTNGVLTIQMKELIRDVSIKIFNLSGQLIYSDLINNNKTIQLENNIFKSGTYLLKISNSEINEVRKIVVK